MPPRSTEFNSVIWMSKKSVVPVIFFPRKSMRPVIFFSKKSARPVIFGDQKSLRPAAVLTGPVSDKFCSLPYVVGGMCPHLSVLCYLHTDSLSPMYT